MQRLNIKKCKLLELHVTQIRHYLSILQKKMSKFETPKNAKKSCKVHKIGGAHF